MKEEAEKAVTELKANDQADIIVASIHAGQQNSDPAASADQVIENVAGIDAYILGHDHLSFTRSKEQRRMENCTGRGTERYGDRSCQN